MPHLPPDASTLVSAWLFSCHGKSPLGVPEGTIGPVHPRPFVVAAAVVAVEGVLGFSGDALSTADS